MDYSTHITEARYLCEAGDQCRHTVREIIVWRDAHGECLTEPEGAISVVREDKRVRYRHRDCPDPGLRELTSDQIASAVLRAVEKRVRA